MKKVHLEFDFKGRHYFAILRVREKGPGKEFAITVLDWKLERLLYGNRLITEVDGSLEANVLVGNKEQTELKLIIAAQLAKHLQMSCFVGGQCVAETPAEEGWEELHPLPRHSQGHFSGLSGVCFFLAMLACQAASAQTKPWVAPAAAVSVTNPLKGNQTVLKDGKTLYITNCAPCHGDKGKGDGPAAAALSPKPADHTSALVQQETDGSLFWKISEGRNPMPTYKAVFTEAQRWELINYIRSLGGSKK